ncbi:MAG: hypothetical protein HC941_07480 [Microcoleus sp. SU_5_3]|nr:hypothetical protein [Microcoleus sp. SU_5_3]
MEVLQDLRVTALWLCGLCFFRDVLGLALDAPGLERQATQYPCWRQFTMLDEVVSLCQVLRTDFALLVATIDSNH